MRIALVLVAACWTGAEPVAPSPPAPPRHARVAHQPAPILDEPTTPPVPINIALAAQLRSTGDVDLPTWVSGPVVVLDFDAGAVQVLCGAAAATAAQTLGQLFVDPKRPEPTCRSNGADYTCMQFQATSIVYVELDTPGSWRIKAAIVGQVARPNTALVAQMRTQLANATCP